MVSPPNTIEKRLLWHPRRANKFVVGGLNQITLYEWAPEFPEIKRGTSQHDLQHMRCFAWSPDPTFDDLFAIGTTTGRVDLLRLEANKQSRQHNTLSSGPTASLTVKSTRACSALAFNSVDPNYLAVGLEKVRDNSLVIWDISTTTPSLIFSPGPYSYDTVRLPPTTPRPSPGIARADQTRSDQTRSDPRILQQHAPAEHVLSLAFLPQSTHLLFAASNRWLKFYDLRSPVSTSQNVNIKVQGIATDPFDIHRVACFNEGTVSIWDHRKLTHPILTITEKDGAADGSLMRSAPYAMVEFSSTRRGTLATLQRDGVYVRFWDLMNVQFSDRWMENERMRDAVGRTTTRRGWSIPSWTSTQTPSPIRSTESSSTLLLAETIRTKYFEGVLSSFALVPPQDPTSHPLTSNVIVVNKEGDLELYAVHDTAKQNTWNARGDLVYGAGKTLRVLGGITGDGVVPEPWEIASHHHQNHPGSPKRGHGRTHKRASSFDRDSDSGESPERGREWGVGDARYPAERAPPPALFGRGDEDGFPALGANTTAAATATATATIEQGGISAQRPHRDQEKTKVHVRSHQIHDSRRDSARTAVSGRKKSTSTSRRGRVKGVRSVVEEDISMVIRRRALLGYGLSKPEHNVYATRDPRERDATPQALSELWDWIHHTQEVLSTPTSQVHGFDFAFQGLLGIWEGFPPLPSTSQASTSGPPQQAQQQQLHSSLKPDPAFRDLLEPPTLLGPGHRTIKRSLSPGEELHGNYHSALLVLIGRSGLDKGQWKPMVGTARALQRQVGLWVCGWWFGEEEFGKMVERWEAEGSYSRAACWLVFTRRYSEAVKLLMQSEDESHGMMSGTIAALIPSVTSGAAGGPGGSTVKSPELREHCERLIVRLHDPYFRALLTQLISGDWTDVLEEDIFPLRERLAIAFQFLDDKALSSYLRRVTERAVSNGDVDGLVVTGLTKQGMDVLQGFVDRTGDVQTAAILGSYVCPMRFKDHRVDRWLEAYRDMLDGFKLHHHRVGFDIERGQRLQDAVQAGEVSPQSAGGHAHAEWAQKQVLLRCGYCSKIIDTSGENHASDQQQGQTQSQAQSGFGLGLGFGGPGSQPQSQLQFQSQPQSQLSKQSQQSQAQKGQFQGRIEVDKSTLCPHCGKYLPRCSVCLMTLGIVQDKAREQDLLQSSYRGMSLFFILNSAL
ncbi:hypothetical protein AX16_008269 [Volvariella volvacea WC 439]|nr:hypothetical protein AX16_008269 [Volvariella volvacea WC 439]